MEDFIPDQREHDLPCWFELEDFIYGYHTKGKFGTFTVTRPHESTKTMIVKMIKIPDPNVVDPFVCESIDAVEEDDFDLVKVPKAKDTSSSTDDGQPKRLTRVKYIDPIEEDFKPGQAQLMRRLQVFKSIKAKNVIPFRGYQEVDGTLWYMSSYFNQRSVSDIAKYLGRPMKEDECCEDSEVDLTHPIKLSVGILRALTYLRYRRIVHGNIKASNVFRDPESGVGILGDFRIPGVHTFDKLADPKVSLHYMSPELLLSKGEEASPKSDLWAWAATVVQLMTRYTPHSELDKTELEKEYSKVPLERPQLPRLALDHCKDFLATCFTEVKKRPTAELLLVHPWVVGDLSPGLSHIELNGTLLSDYQNANLIGVYGPSEDKIPGADLNRPIYRHCKNRVYIFYFEATASWQVAEMKDLGRPRAMLYVQDDVRWPQLIGKPFKGWSKQVQNWVEIEDVSIDVFYVAED